MLRRADRVPFALRDHADEIALAQDARAGNVGDRSFVEARDLRARSINALAARANNASVDHPRQAHVLQVNVFAAHFVGNVVSRGTLAHQFVIRDGLQRRRTGECEAERLITDKLTVGDGARGAHHGDDSSRYSKVFDRRAEFFRRELQ